MNLSLQKMRTSFDVGHQLNKLKTGAVALFLLLCTVASATHYRYGNMSWQLVPGQANTVDVTIQHAWRKSAFSNSNVGQVVNTGSLIIPGQSSRSILITVTSVNLVEDWFFGTFTTRITFPGPGTYPLSYSGCCRISTLQNNRDGSYRNETVVVIGNGNNGPNSTVTPIINMQAGQAGATFQIPATDPDGDPLSFRLATSAETSANTPAPGFSVSPTGLATFNTIGKAVGQLYQAAVTVEDTAGAKSILDFIIRIVNTSNPPTFDYAVTPPNGTIYSVRPGDTVKFKVKAFDVDPGDIVTINAVGVPIGATFTPNIVTAGGNPDSTVFCWYPTNANLGTSVINFTAEDNNNVQANTSVSIIVSQKPRFDVPPTPAQGVHMFYECGDTIKYMVQASDLDPNDSVVINKVEGKAMNGSKIPLYAGATFTPLPSPLANPTSGMFEWIVGPTDWGHRHVFFTAEDQNGEKEIHEVSQIINSAPKITSTPDTCVYVDSLFYYKIVVMDKDTANGDSIDIYVSNAPSWLTFTDLGNGCGILSGTPGVGDVGTSFNIQVEGQDIHHHATGSAYQYFNLTVKDSSAVDTGCVVAGSLNLVSDGSWMMSTITTGTNLSGSWAGVGGVLPADATFTVPAMVGQPYNFPSIDSVDGAQVLKTTRDVTYFQKKFMIDGNDDMAARVKMTVDDHTEIYINGQLLVAQYTGQGSNFKNPAFDVMFMSNGTVVSPNAGGEAFSFTTFSSLGDLFVPGMNTITVAVRNYAKNSDKGGFSLLVDLDYTYQTGNCEALDSCVSDSTWKLSTVVTTATANSYPWPGVGSVPPAATFTLPVVVGQPYPWTHLYTVPGSEVISALSGVTYYRKTFELNDHIGVNTRIRMFMDDDVEVFINGNLLAREDGMGKENWRTANHDILFKSDNTVDNGHMGGDAFDFVGTVDMDTVLKPGMNDIVLAIRNRTSKPDKGGFSFRMDMDKAGNPVIKKSSGFVRNSASDELVAKVYPNPTSDWVNVVIPEYTAETTGEVILVDVNGRELERLDIDNDEVQLNVAAYASGIYFVKVNTNGVIHTAKVFKK